MDLSSVVAAAARIPLPAESQEVAPSCSSSEDEDELELEETAFTTRSATVKAALLVNLSQEPGMGPGGAAENEEEEGEAEAEAPRGTRVLNLRSGRKPVQGRGGHPHNDDDEEAKTTNKQEEEEEEEGPDPIMLDEISDAVLSNADRRRLKPWAFLVVENHRDPATWHLPYRDTLGRMNRPLMSEAREILKSPALVRAKRLLLTGAMLRDFAKLCCQAWPNQPAPRFVRGVDEDEEDGSGADEDGYVKSPTSSNVLKGTAAVLREASAVERKLAAAASPASLPPIRQQLGSGDEDEDEGEDEGEGEDADHPPPPSKRNDVSVDLLLKFRKARSEQQQRMGAAPPVRNRVVVVQPRDRHRVELVRLAQSRFLDVRNRKAAAARKVDARYEPVVAPTPPALAHALPQQQDEQHQQEEPGDAAAADIAGHVDPVCVDATHEDESVVASEEHEEDDENAVEEEGDADNEHGDGDEEDANSDAENDDNASSPSKPPTEVDEEAQLPATDQQHPDREQDEPRNLAYRRMLEADARKASSKRGKTADLLAEEASEEEEDEAVGNYGGGLILGGGNKGGGEDDEDLHPHDLRPTDDDLKHIVDSVSDDEGERDAAELFRQQVDAKDEAELKRIQKDIENHTLARRRRNHDGTRLGRALNEEGDDSETDEEIEMARQERYEAEAKERLAELQAARVNGGASVAAVNEAMEEVLAEEEQARRFLSMSRLARQRSTTTTDVGPTAATASQSTLPPRASTLMEFNDDNTTFWPLLDSSSQAASQSHFHYGSVSATLSAAPFETENTNVSIVQSKSLSQLPQSVSLTDGTFVKSIVRELKRGGTMMSSSATAAPSLASDLGLGGGGAAAPAATGGVGVTASSGMAFISSKKFVYAPAAAATVAMTTTSSYHAALPAGPTSSLLPSESATSSSVMVAGGKKRMALSQQPSMSSAIKRRREQVMAAAKKPVALSRTASLLLEEASRPSSSHTGTRRG